MVIPPEVLLLLRIVFTILGFLIFHMKLRITLSMSVKNCVGILTGIALNQQLTLYDSNFPQINLLVPSNLGSQEVKISLSVDKV